jgi:hypothetical protein
MQDCVDPTLGLDLFWERFSDKDSIGRRQLQTQQIWFKSARIAKMCKRSEATLIIDSANTTNLAVAKMGPGSARSTSTSAVQLEICRGGGRIFF